MPAHLKLVEDAVSLASPQAIQDLLDDEQSVFWVDWREEDDAIVEYCERILGTGRLRADVVDDDSEHGFKMYIVYGDKRGRVPLTYCGSDGHVTLVALNVMLRPDYEVR